MTTNSFTDPETGLRFYEWEGKPYPSVTSIRRLIGMPFTLHQWALSQVVDRAIIEHDRIGKMLTRAPRPRERVTNANILKETRSYLRAAATDERDRKGDIGDRAHLAIANGIPLAECAPDIVGYVGQFLDFMEALGAQVVWSERQVFNLRYGYAGTGDALMRLGDGRMAMVDYKTSRGVYIDHLIQLVAYTMAEFVGENDRVDAAATQALEEVDTMAILHLSEQDWEWIEVRSDPALFQGFIGGLAFARFLIDHNHSIDPLVENRRRGGTLIPVLARSLSVVQSLKGGTHPDPD